MAFIVAAPVRPSTTRFSVQAAPARAAKFCVRAEDKEPVKEEKAEASDKPSWAIPEDMKDFDQFMQGRVRKPRSGITFDRENGLMNTWAVEPKMYVEEDRGGFFGGLLKALGLNKDEEKKEN
eukprot:tig00000792_g4203.t1